jgi:hypothetical protein
MNGLSTQQGSDELNQRTQELASALEQTAASMEENDGNGAAERRELESG